MDGIVRTKTIGYVSTYENAISLVRSYMNDIGSTRTENGQLDALDVTSQLDALSPPNSESMIVGADDCRCKNAYDEKLSSQRPRENTNDELQTTNRP